MDENIGFNNEKNKLHFLNIHDVLNALFLFLAQLKLQFSQLALQEIHILSNFTIWWNRSNAKIRMPAY